MHFRRITLPTGHAVLIPSDIQLELPEHTSLDVERRHFLAYIPWDDVYLDRIDESSYKDFFKAILPYMHVRTTDVHVATCIPFLHDLLSTQREAVDEQVVYMAFVLHDVGWSQMSEEEISSSLGITGLALNDDALGPKEKHALLGRTIAMQVLEKEPYVSQLSGPQRELIYNAILYHDRPWELAVDGALPIEMKIVCDVDHFWSFTHEDFWLDIVRKGVSPLSYIKNLSNDLDSYFVTEEGKKKAESLLYERQVEVEAWKRELEGKV